ncbi:cytosolic Fe-S cluster assembly factor NARFL [Thecamonas trahens ATCC 50062]|uniref:Cytosolic Fe-S cluster assembly factor NARFL n=1 Tax=Thecamonas trahens ATCC 50062 TaxID=461836 RepID=A0A0L0DHQ7_THETB|nr:cytosolic Fe-S cluster assembly factor NARFL [Thecamonas trahens ATCC 50062]KNC51847.1 cytosolic Fe-S cluster assembly factor NARFL [Thecamonas trahens ATCC 50062]|eukprot:XP_013755711.1 cytosolic Fe-S cluster assembly factor NARFL [Thecamonas trahens ATCC 50062]
MAFSGPLQLTSLDDYIGPSQDCIIQPRESRLVGGLADSVAGDGAAAEKEAAAAASVALELEAMDEEEGEKGYGAMLSSTGQTSIIRDSSGAVYERVHGAGGSGSAATTTLLAPSTISLSDCLACSGCITTAETVLVSAQSVTKLCEKLTATPKPESIVFSFSSQALSGLALSSGLFSTGDALARAARFCVEHVGARWVLDTELGRQLAESAVVDAVVSAKRTAGGGPAGVLTSSCPGWICYAEKTHPEALPHVARVKSPQAMNGMLVAEYLGAAPETTLHVAVMQCYDKKLEATRAEFTAGDGLALVDLVLTVPEFEALMGEMGVSGGLASMEPLPLTHEVAPLVDVDAETGRLRGVRAHGESDGYAERVLIRAAAALWGLEGKAKFERVGNKDYQAASLSAGEGDARLAAATAFGFRNIQNVVNALGRGVLPYDVVEVQACPSGCLNGGGMPSAEDGSRAGRKAHLAALAELHRGVVDGEHSELAAVNAWLSESERADELVAASFSAVSGLAGGGDGIDDDVLALQVHFFPNTYVEAEAEAEADADPEVTPR